MFNRSCAETANGVGSSWKQSQVAGCTHMCVMLDRKMPQSALGTKPRIATCIDWHKKN